jgi:hypothetical protein
MARTRRIGGADRINPQLLAKFASKIRVSTHALEASESGRRSVCDPARRVDATATDKLYRRRQRRRALIAWGTLGVIVVLVVLGIVFGGDDNTTSGPTPHLFTYEMSSTQYEALHKGETELSVLKQLGSTGLHEDEIEEVDLLHLFPPPAPGATCNFWKLSDAPDHLVRLCFSEAEGLLLEKSVRAPGEGGAETTLA